MYKTKRFIMLLALLTAFPPLSMDMYLPAIPQLQKIWAQPLDVVNLTLVCFFAMYGLALLVYGPLSDRFGRRWPLMAGIGLYVASSVLCAMAGNVTSLIVFRVLQAAGAAAASAISMAICKDVYAGHERQRILAIIGVIMALAPMLAPTMGGWILALASWRWIFLLQGSIGLVALVGVLRMPETMAQASTSSVRQIAGSYFAILRNGRYVSLTALLTLTGVAHFAFIGGSSDIYITGFKLSEQGFGYFFALNALALMLGSMLCTPLSKRLGPNRMLTVGFAGIAVGGCIMLIHALPGPWRLALPMALASFAFGLSRPPSNNLILEQVDKHIGAASSFMIFSYFSMGAVAMWFISLDWSDKVSVIGLCGVVCGGAVLAVWLMMSRMRFLRGVEG